MAERDPERAVDEIREERDERVGHLVEEEPSETEQEFLESEGVRLDPEDDSGRPLAP